MLPGDFVRRYMITRLGVTAARLWSGSGGFRAAGSFLSGNQGFATAHIRRMSNALAQQVDPISTSKHREAQMRQDLYPARIVSGKSLCICGRECPVSVHVIPSRSSAFVWSGGGTRVRMPFALQTHLVPAIVHLHFHRADFYDGINQAVGRMICLGGTQVPACLGSISHARGRGRHKHRLRRTGVPLST